MTSASSRTSRTLLTGAVVLPDRVVSDGAVAVTDGIISYAGERGALSADWVDVAEPDGWQAGLTLLPGLVDIHCHGGNGGEFGADAGGGHRAARHHHQQGTTTIVTRRYDGITWAVLFDQRDDPSGLPYDYTTISAPLHNVANATTTWPTTDLFGQYY